MADELIDALTSMTTHDPEEAYIKLIESYNTSFDNSSIDSYLVSCYSRYKTYKINVNFSEFPKLLNNINQFIQYYDSFPNKKKELFKLSKTIDKEIISIIDE
jgi:hypothetical protein